MGGGALGTMELVFAMSTYELINRHSRIQSLLCMPLSFRHAAEFPAAEYLGVSSLPVFLQYMSRPREI
jgi:hypothetical protein